MNSFISLGIAMIVAIVFGKVMNKLKIPSVAGYIIAGLLLGVSGLNILSTSLIEETSFISDFALCIIAFNIGSELELSVIKKLGKSIFIIAACEALGAFVLVSGITYVLTSDITIALILGAVSAATAPAATVMVLKEYKAKGPLTSTLLGVVAVDDAICLMIYAMASAVTKVFINHDVITINKILVSPILEILMSILVGIIIGLALTYLVTKVNKDNELLPVIIGSLFIVDGIAMQFGLSPLLTSMVLGIIVANSSKKKRKVFNVVEQFSPPITAMFFVLAGARLNIAYLPQIGILGAAYLIFRVGGKIGGATLGAKISKSPDVVRKYLGFGLLSQVGVAIGLAITVGREFPGTELADIVVTILLATTIVTELVGPLTTKYAVIKSGEGNSKKKERVLNE